MSGRWLLLRRAEALWAIPSTAVRAVRRCGDGAEVELRDRSSLHAEQLLEIASRFERRSFPSCVSAGTSAAAGLAVWQGLPVVCIDPAGELPPALLATPTTPDTLATGEREDADARQ